jgi:hypothetical protein
MPSCGQRLRTPHGVMEAYFERHGRAVASHPLWVIGACAIVTAAFAGLLYLNFHWETNAIRLWIPSSSDFLRNYDRLWSSEQPPDMRFHSVIFVAEGDADANVLRPEYLAHMAKVRQRLQLSAVGNKTWRDFCFR